MRAADRRILDELDPRLRPGVEGILLHVNHPSKVGAWELRPHCGYRSAAAQLTAYQAGHTKLRKGAHNYQPARACDLVWWHPEGGWSWNQPRLWWFVGYWAEHYGLTWGGRWGTPTAARRQVARAGMALGWDCPHVEIPGWARLAVVRVTGIR